MIAVDTNNAEYRHSAEPQEGRLDPFESPEVLVPKGEDGPSKSAGRENCAPLASKEAPADANTDEDDKPHDLPPVVHTDSNDHHNQDDANSHNDLFSASFDGDADYFNEHASLPSYVHHSSVVGAPLTTVSISETEVSTPSVRDLIRFFGSPKRKTPPENKQYPSGGSVHTDVPFTNHNRQIRDDDSSLGDLSFSSMPVSYEPHGSPGRTKTTCELDMLREQSIVSSRRRHQTRSAARRDRLHYKLGNGKKGMSEKDLNRSRTFLPADKLIAMKQQEQTPKVSTEPELYVWLLSPTHKVFEVVRVPYSIETSIGDVLVMARAAALDPVLAEQRYVSLCNEKLELVAPSLPINFLFHRRKDTPSVMAVPFGSTAVAIREIHHALTSNRRVRKWLKQKDIFRPLSEEEKLHKRREKQKKKERSKNKQT